MSFCGHLPIQAGHLRLAKYSRKGVRRSSYWYSLPLPLSEGWACHSATVRSPASTRRSSSSRSGWPRAASTGAASCQSCQEHTLQGATRSRATEERKALSSPLGLKFHLYDCVGNGLLYTVSGPRSSIVYRLSSMKGVT